MSDVTAVQIVQPMNAGRERAAGSRAETVAARGLVVAHADAFARRPLFAHSGMALLGGRPMVSAPFLAQHIDQEWVRRDRPVDTRLVARSYARAAAVPASRQGLARLV